jgi:hypothetical protein
VARKTLLPLVAVTQRSHDWRWKQLASDFENE